MFEIMFEFFFGHDIISNIECEQFFLFCFYVFWNWYEKNEIRFDFLNFRWILFQVLQ